MTSNTPRNPLSNLTNTITPTPTSSSSSSTPANTFSTASLTKINNTHFSNSNKNVVVSPNPKTPSFIGDGGRRQPGSVYTRRRSTAKSKLKGKHVCVNAGLDSGGENKSEDVQTKSTAKPPKKKKRKISSEEDVANHSLPQDFVEKQRAYFAEIDKFELSEEEATADDLE